MKFLLSLLGGAPGFLMNYWKPIVIAILAVGIFFAGLKWEQRAKDLEIANLIANYAKKEKDRTEAINKKIKEIEDSSTAAADELAKEKVKHSEDVSKLLKKYKNDLATRDKKVTELTKRLADLKQQGGNTKEIEQVEKELNGLKLSYQLSPEAVQTINGLVEEYAK